MEGGVENDEQFQIPTWYHREHLLQASPQPTQLLLQPSEILKHWHHHETVGKQGGTSNWRFFKKKNKTNTLLCFTQVASASLFYILKFYKLTVVCLSISDFVFSSAVFNIHISPLFQKWKETKRTEYTEKKNNQFWLIMNICSIFINKAPSTHGLKASQAQTQFFVLRTSLLLLTNSHANSQKQGNKKFPIFTC